MYYRRAALLKESYLPFFFCFLPKVLPLPVRFRRRTGTRYVGDGARSSFWGKAQYWIHFASLLLLITSYPPSFFFTSPVLAPRLSPMCKKYWISSNLYHLHYLGFNITQEWHLQKSPGKAGVHFRLPSSPSYCCLPTIGSGSFHDSSKCSASSALQYHRPLFPQNIRLESRSYRL